MDNKFLKKLNEMKIKDVQKRMGLTNSVNLYSTENDGIVYPNNESKNSSNMK